MMNLESYLNLQCPAVKIKFFLNIVPPQLPVSADPFAKALVIKVMWTLIEKKNENNMTWKNLTMFFHDYSHHVRRIGDFDWVSAVNS